jgi:thiamine-phosphate pyrophosphorylase
MSRLVIITHPTQFQDEIAICKKLFDSGLETLHVRKPNWTDKQLSVWLKQFSEQELKKCVIHHDKKIFEMFPLKGLHVSYSKTLPILEKGTLSCSVHHWKEAYEIAENCDYYFISPVFDSISKHAYTKNPELNTIPFDLDRKKIIALGGIDADNIEEVFDMGYRGVALLGYIWSDPAKAVGNFTKLNQLRHA